MWGARTADYVIHGRTPTHRGHLNMPYKRPAVPEFHRPLATSATSKLPTYTYFLATARLTNFRFASLIRTPTPPSLRHDPHCCRLLLDVRMAVLECIFMFIAMQWRADHPDDGPFSQVWPHRPIGKEGAGGSQLGRGRDGGAVQGMIREKLLGYFTRIPEIAAR